MSARSRVAALLACTALLAATSASAQDALVDRGAYLAKLGDCAACHTAPGGADFAGGLAIKTPLGAIVATNITPSAAHGIGNYSLAQFSAALRQGLRSDGTHLYPAMPYTAYAGLSDGDVAALYAYFRQSVAPVEQSPPATQLAFPFNLRGSMIGWNQLFLKSSPFSPDPQHSESWNRGAYLAETLGHCGTCHTPRNLFQAEQAGRVDQGASLGDWYAPNLTGLTSSSGWTRDLLLAYLRDGQATDKGFSAQAAGPMLEVVEKSLSHWTDEDRAAVAEYLLSLPASAAAKPTQGHALTSDVALRAEAPASPDKMDGAQLYDAYCASCHQMSGNGVGGLPALLGNSALAGANSDNVVMAILEGVWPQGLQAMPAFATHLSDAQTATLTNYLSAQFGQSTLTTTADHVADLRRGPGPARGLMAIVWASLAVAGLALIGGTLRLLRRRR